MQNMIPGGTPNKIISNPENEIQEELSDEEESIDISKSEFKSEAISTEERN